MIGDKTSGLGTLCHWRLLAWSSPTETSASPCAENTLPPLLSPRVQMCLRQNIFCNHYVEFSTRLSSLPWNFTSWWINLSQKNSSDLLNFIFVFISIFYSKLCTINVSTNLSACLQFPFKNILFFVAILDYQVLLPGAILNSKEMFQLKYGLGIWKLLSLK